MGRGGALRPSGPGRGRPAADAGEDAQLSAPRACRRPREPPPPPPPLPGIGMWRRRVRPSVRPSARPPAAPRASVLPCGRPPPGSSPRSVRFVSPRLAVSLSLPWRSSQPLPRSPVSGPRRSAPLRPQSRLLRAPPHLWGPLPQNTFH